MATSFLTALSLLAAIPGIYLSVLALAALTRRRRRATCPQNTDSTRFAILIPAHDEALSIAATIDSVQRSSYDPRFRKVFVIADNCSDATASIATTSGARIAERHDQENPGKGQAIDWFLKTRRKQLASFDAIVVIDADTLMDASFLTEASQALANPEVEVLQGHYGVSNSDQSWRAGLCEVAFASVHHLRPLGRNAIGSTAGLKGNGMVFRSMLLSQTGWPAHSIVEDLEFTGMLAMQDIRVRYLPRATVLAEMAVDSAAATSQRRRWESGRWELTKSQVPQLLLRFLRTGKVLFLDTALDLLTPPITLYLLASLPIAAASLLLGVHPLLALAGFVGASFHLVTALAHRGVSRHAWKALLGAPLFVGWKAALYLRFAFSKSETRWVRTRRAAETDLDIDPATITRTR